jgi:hypothetical protein
MVWPPILWQSVSICTSFEGLYSDRSFLLKPLLIFDLSPSTISFETCLLRVINVREQALSAAGYFPITASKTCHYQETHCLSTLSSGSEVEQHVFHNVR